MRDGLRLRLYEDLIHADEVRLYRSALVLNPIMALLARGVGVRRTFRVAVLVGRAASPGLRQHVPSNLERVASIVRYAARRAPLRNECLEQSLVLAAVLVAIGEHPTLVSGVRKTLAEFDVHVWVEVAGEPLAEYGDFVPMQRFASATAG